MKKIIYLFLLLIFSPFISAMEQGENDLYFQLRTNIEQQNYQQVTELLQQDIDININKEFWVPLIDIAMARINYNENIFKAMIKKIGDINNTKDYGFSPLRKAVFYLNVNAIEDLIKVGADVNAGSKNEYCIGMTPLMEASQYSYSIVYQLLAAGANPNLQDGKGETALMYLIQQSEKPNEDIERFVQKAKLLLAAGAKLSIRDKSGETVLQKKMKPELKTVLEEELVKRKKVYKPDQSIVSFRELAQLEGFYASFLPKDVVNKVAQYYADIDI